MKNIIHSTLLILLECNVNLIIGPHSKTDSNKFYCSVSLTLFYTMVTSENNICRTQVGKKKKPCWAILMAEGLKCCQELKCFS